MGSLGAVAAIASLARLGYDEDISTTAKLMAAGRIIGIPVFDHVIVTRDSRIWHSMFSRGTLPKLPDEG